MDVKVSRYIRQLIDASISCQ